MGDKLIESMGRIADTYWFGEKRRTVQNFGLAAMVIGLLLGAYSSTWTAYIGTAIAGAGTALVCLIVVADIALWCDERRG